MRGQLFETPTLPKTSFAGKTLVITGGNTGLGFECAKQVFVVLGQWLLSSPRCLLLTQRLQCSPPGLRDRARVSGSSERQQSQRQYPLELYEQAAYDTRMADRHEQLCLCQSIR